MVIVMHEFVVELTYGVCGISLFFPLVCFQGANMIFVAFCAELVGVPNPTFSGYFVTTISFGIKCMVSDLILCCM